MGRWYIYLHEWLIFLWDQCSWIYPFCLPVDAVAGYFSKSLAGPSPRPWGFWSDQEAQGPTTLGFKAPSSPWRFEWLDDLDVWNIPYHGLVDCLVEKFPLLPFPPCCNLLLIIYRIFQVQSLDEDLFGGLHSLKLTANAPEHRPPRSQKDTSSSNFQPLMFRGHASFRDTMMRWHDAGDDLYAGDWRW